MLIIGSFYGSSYVWPSAFFHLHLNGYCIYDLISDKETNDMRKQLFMVIL